MEGLTTGRIVHYTDESGECQAAVVSKVWNKSTGLVNLHVFPESSASRPVTSREFDSDGTHKLYTWHWTEKA